MEQLFEQMPDLTAVFAMADVLAVGAIRAVRDRGLRVPEDVSVMGFDGIELGNYPFSAAHYGAPGQRKDCRPEPRNSALGYCGRASGGA